MAADTIGPENAWTGLDGAAASGEGAGGVEAGTSTPAEAMTVIQVHVTTANVQQGIMTGSSLYFRLQPAPPCSDTMPAHGRIVKPSGQTAGEGPYNLG